jgi:hypothetical protein
MLAFLVSAVSVLLAMAFAAIWGAQLFDTAVLVPVFASEPPKSLVEWLATPYPMRVVGFFRIVVPSVWVAAVIALVVAVATGLRMHLAMAVASVFGLVHMAMVVLIFIPTNRKLGFHPGGPSASSLDPQMVTTLVLRWGRWNFVRLGVETAGLIAALFAVKAS